MLLNRIVSWLLGYVEILVRGPHLEKFINLATNSGLVLWDVKRVGPDVLHVKLRAHGFRRIREYARRSQATVRLHRKRGWPFSWRKMRRRRTFLLGSVLFVGGLIYLSTLVLVIRVEGFEGADRQQLFTTLAKLGVKPGVTRRSLLTRKTMVEREVMLEMPQAVWFGLNLRGVVADVTVVKRKVPPPARSSYDLIAGRDGLVTKVAVIRGTSAVKEGDTVAPGDLLISGIEWQSDKASGELVKIPVPANGIVEARVWQDIEVTEPRLCWRALPERERLTAYSLRVGKRLWPLFRLGKRPVANYSWTRWQKRLYQGRNPALVVEIIKDTWQAARWVKVVRTPAELKAAALREAAERRKYLPGRGGKRTVHWSTEGNFLKLIVTYESIQDIALIAPLKDQPPESPN
ncbi:hypothetical protein EDC14_101744 [Hydrogenispora ethanolica]|uniref:Stage IV sporulation protein n=1 Tax=Hydrogenispora ethanolica TaxID=1082276 RepID=A0A4R1RH95_HYDET|nr:sporulation protein YqfD [Hydrogenispora ethanolica]TCL65296.1 hypothetical protein EDC14_101744 [Hydrogenispora ethanolica]